MASDNLQICTKCYCLKEKSLFVSKSGRQLKSCKICRDKSSDLYVIKKSGQNNHEANEINIIDETDETDKVSPLTMQEMIYDKINVISQNDSLENEHLGLDFTCTISTSSFEGTPQERANQIIEIITKGDGYHYM